MEEGRKELKPNHTLHILCCLSSLSSCHFWHLFFNLILILTVCTESNAEIPKVTELAANTLNMNRDQSSLRLFSEKIVLGEIEQSMGKNKID